MADVRYRWIEGPLISKAEWRKETTAIFRIMDARGWMSLNQRTSRILVAEDADSRLLAFMVMQLIPHTEPLWVLPSERGSGIAEELADKMLDFMFTVQSRGWMVVADNPSAAKLCEERGMSRVESPVYVAK